MLLIDQDQENTYEYTGQTLYSVPVLSPQGDLWGFNLHLEGVPELLGTFDSLAEITAEIAAIAAQNAPEHFISGSSDYDGIEDFESLCALVDGLTEDEYD